MAKPPPVPPEFLAQYDAERARILRRRAVWYCAAVLFILAGGWWSTISDLLDADRYPVSTGTASADIIFTTLFTLIFARALVYFARRPRPRAEIVRAFQWLILTVGIAVAVVLDLLRHAPWSADTLPLRTPDDDLAQAAASLTVLFVLHSLSSLLVALSPREGLAPMLPVLGAFALWVLVVSAGPLEQKAALILASPLAALPGFAWSWWRYRSFAERFHARAVHKRYAEVSRELTDARRVHEALFPPPITRGPVRVNYKYEPMREIGGDFLFVRPLSFPPSRPAGPVLVVLIDVTGHGIAAALAVNRLHAELERISSAGAMPDPVSVVGALNQFACAMLAPQAMFATAFCLRITPGEGGAALEWAGAGHPPALLRAATGEVRRLESTAPMLGIIDADMFVCEPAGAELATGDAVVIYTDGAYEATDGRGRELGLDGIEGVVRAGAAGRSLPEAIAQSVERFRAGPAADDILIVEVALAPADA